MGILIIIILFFGVLFIFGNSRSDKTKNELIAYNDKRKKYYKESENLDYLESLYYVKYLGGFKDIGKKEEISILLFEDRIRLQFDDKLYRDILKNNILNCCIENKTQIINQISMGKILCLGVFALGGNNSKEINKEYLVIECKPRNDKISIVLEFENQMRLEKASQDINKLIELDIVNENEFHPYFE